HRRALRAIDEGRFEREIVPVELRVAEPVGGTSRFPQSPLRRAMPSSGDLNAHTEGAPARTDRFAVDETPRRDTSLDALAALEPAFVPGGKITAGSSSQICDGAAAVLVASERAVERLDLEPRARFVAFGLAGVDPRLMLHGNPLACDRALSRASLRW